MAAAALPLHAGAAPPQCDAAPGTFFNVFAGSLETIMVPVVTGSLEITNASVLPSVAGSVEGKVAAPTDVNWASVPAGAVVNFLTGNPMTLDLPPITSIDSYTGAPLEIANSPAISELGPGQARDLNTGGVITIVGMLPFLCAAH